MRSDEAPTVLQIDGSQCIGCAICVDVCPKAALVMGPDALRPTCLAALCTACGECVRECPTAAITLGLELAAPAP